MGNAAHGLHPVAGQGLNLGLRDVAALADVVADVVQEVPGAAVSGDVGSDVVLRRYEAWRVDDQRNIVNFTDGLVRAFTNPFAPVRLAGDWRSLRWMRCHLGAATATVRGPELRGP